MSGALTSLITPVYYHIGSLYNIEKAVVVCLENSATFVRDNILHSLHVIHCATIVLYFLSDQKLKISYSFLVYSQIIFLLIYLSQCMWWTSTKDVFGFFFVLFFSLWNVSSKELLWQLFFLQVGSEVSRRLLFFFCFSYIQVYAFLWPSDVALFFFLHCLSCWLLHHQFILFFLSPLPLLLSLFSLFSDVFFGGVISFRFYRFLGVACVVYFVLNLLPFG
jgi:hypothetical protein